MSQTFQPNYYQQNILSALIDLALVTKGTSTNSTEHTDIVLLNALQNLNTVLDVTDEEVIIESLLREKLKLIAGMISSYTTPQRKASNFFNQPQSSSKKIAYQFSLLSMLQTISHLLSQPPKCKDVYQPSIDFIYSALYVLSQDTTEHELYIHNKSGAFLVSHLLKALEEECKEI